MAQPAGKPQEHSASFSLVVIKVFVRNKNVTVSPVGSQNNKHFIVLALIFRPLIHSELNFVFVVRSDSNFIFPAARSVG